MFRPRCFNHVICHPSWQITPLHSSTCLTTALWSWNLMRCLETHWSSASCYSSQQLQDEKHWQAQSCVSPLLEEYVPLAFGAALHVCASKTQEKKLQNKRTRHLKDNKWRRRKWENSMWKWCVGYWAWHWLYSTKLSHKYPTWFTFVVWELPDDPGWLVSVQVNIQNVTKSLWVQITPCSDHSCRRQATLPPGNMGHDVHWKRQKKEQRVGDVSRGQGAECVSPAPTWLWGNDHHCIRAEMCQLRNESSVQVDISLNHADIWLLAAPCVGCHHYDPGAGRGWQI